MRNCGGARARPPIVLALNMSMKYIGGSDNEEEAEDEAEKEEAEEVAEEGEDEEGEDNDWAAERGNVQEGRLSEPSRPLARVPRLDHVSPQHIRDCHALIKDRHLEASGVDMLLGNEVVIISISSDGRVKTSSSSLGGLILAKKIRQCALGLRRKGFKEFAANPGGYFRKNQHALKTYCHVLVDRCGPEIANDMYTKAKHEDAGLAALDSSLTVGQCGKDQILLRLRAFEIVGYHMDSLRTQVLESDMGRLTTEEGNWSSPMSTPENTHHDLNDPFGIQHRVNKKNAKERSRARCVVLEPAILALQKDTRRGQHLNGTSVSQLCRIMHVSLACELLFPLH